MRGVRVCVVGGLKNVGAIFMRMDRASHFDHAQCEAIKAPPTLQQDLLPRIPQMDRNLMTCLVDSAIRINAIPSSKRARPVSPGG